MEIQHLPSIPNTLFRIPALTGELNSGLIVHWFGPKKLIISKLPDGASRFPEMRSPRCVRVCGKISSRRVSGCLGPTSVSGTTIDQARCEAAFHYKPSFRLGAAISEWKRGAAMVGGRPFSFILYAARFSESN